jgi:motility quorum-sensing regulator / GCU-specific mRNA interferase toxin
MPTGPHSYIRQATIQTISGQQFFKSMTSYGIIEFGRTCTTSPSPAGTLYVKFTADAVTEFVLLSFKEKDDD